MYEYIIGNNKESLKQRYTIWSLKEYTLKFWNMAEELISDLPYWASSRVEYVRNCLRGDFCSFEDIQSMLSTFGKDWSDSHWASSLDDIGQASYCDKCKLLRFCTECEYQQTANAMAEQPRELCIKVNPQFVRGLSKSSLISISSMSTLWRSIHRYQKPRASNSNVIYILSSPLSFLH